MAIVRSLLAKAARKFTQIQVPGLFRQNDKIEQFDAIMRQHDAGRFNQSALLVDEVLTADRISAVVQTRQGGLLSAPFTVSAAGESRLQKKIADELGGTDAHGGIWEEIASPATIAGLLEWGWFLGVAVAQIVWDAQPTKHTPRLVLWHPANLRWDDFLLRFVLNTREGEVILPRPDEQPRGDGEWFVWCPFGVHYGWKRGLLRSLAFKYMSLNWTERDWDRFNELRAMGLIKAIVPNNAGDDGERFFDDVSNMGSEPYVKCPQGATKDIPGYDIQAVEFGSTGTMWQSLSGRKADINTDVAVLVLGQNLTTEVAAGSLASTKEHSKVRIDKALQDAGIAPAIRSQVITHWAERNNGDPELAPTICYEVEPPDDDKGNAAALKLLGEAGQALLLADPQVDVATLFESEGIPRLSDEEFAAIQAEEEEKAAAAAAANPDGVPSGDEPSPGDKAQKPKTLSGTLEHVINRYEFCDLPIAVENPRGTIRPWTDASGKTGHTRLLHDYGFIEGYLGRDKEELDCYVGPVPDAPDVYVVHQRGPLLSGRWGDDEDKVFLGFGSAEDAKAAFLAHRDDGERAFGGMKVLPMEQFKARLRRRGTAATTKLASVADTTASIMALVGRARGAKALAKTVAGERRADKYQDLLVANGVKRAALALAPYLRGLKAEIDGASSLAELRPQLLRVFKGADAAKLATVLRRVGVLANVSGQAGARAEVGHAHG